MPRIVLTGATGLVGRHAAVALSRRHELFAVSRRPLASMPGMIPCALDLTGPWLPEVLPTRADAVVHLAQSGAWQEFPGGALDMCAVNLTATARLLDYAVGAGASHFVLASTGGLYGSRESAVTEETALASPSGALRYYFETKRAAELLAAAYSDHLHVIILRPFFVYGTGQRASMLVPRLIDSVRQGRAISVRGKDGTRLNPVHVDDMVATIEACLRQDRGFTVNVAGSEIATLRAIATHIGECLGIEARFVHGSGDPDTFVADVSRMSALMGREPLPFSEGIKSVLRGARA